MTEIKSNMFSHLYFVILQVVVLFITDTEHSLTSQTVDQLYSQSWSNCSPLGHLIIVGNFKFWCRSAAGLRCAEFSGLRVLVTGIDRASLSDFIYGGDPRCSYTNLKQMSNRLTSGWEWARDVVLWTKLAELSSPYCCFVFCPSEHQDFASFSDHLILIVIWDYFLTGTVISERQLCNLKKQVKKILPLC